MWLAFLLLCPCYACCQLNLYESGVELDISLYGEFCDLLSDEYEVVRITVMKLIQILSSKYPDW